jgi:superfamily II DNA helicase RecQ
VVVYCQTVPQTKTLATLLQCDAYHHHAADKDIKMRAFQSGEQSLIVSTSAFGMGVDISNIRVIIHIDEPRSLLDYAQESGRAGRDGQKSDAIIVLPPRASRHTQPSWQPPNEKMDEADRRVVWDFIEARCQREVMDRFMDGTVSREGCGSDEEACQGCCRELDTDKREESSPRAHAIREKSESDDHSSHDGNGSDSSGEDESEDSFRERGGGDGEEEGSESRKRGHDEAWWHGHEFKKQHI